MAIQMGGSGGLGRVVRALAVVACAAVVTIGATARPAGAATQLELATVAPEGSRYTKDLRALGSEIERVTGGEVTVKWHTAGRLGDEKKIADLLRAPEARLQGAGLTGVGCNFLVPEMRVWVYPGLFQSFAEVEYLEQRYRAELEGYFDREGFVVVAWANVGFTYLHSASKLDSWDDLKKRRLWLWADDEVGIAATQALGIALDTTTLADLQTWLRDKKIDVWAYPPLAVVGMGLTQYSRYMSDMPYTLLEGALVIRKDAFAALSPGAQRAILAVGDKWETRLTKSWRAENEKAAQAMQKQGTRVVSWSLAERERFFQEAARGRGVFAKRWGIEAFMRRFTDDLDAYRKGKPR